MHLTIIQLHMQSLPLLGQFSSVKFLAQFIFSIGRPHDDTHINASNVFSSFNQLLQSLFTQLCLENPRSHIGVLAKLKLQSVPSPTCKSYWNLEVSRVSKIGVQLCLYLQIAGTVFCDRQFLVRPSLWKVETLQSTYLWSAPHIKYN